MPPEGPATPRAGSLLHNGTPGRRVEPGTWLPSPRSPVGGVSGAARGDPGWNDEQGAGSGGVPGYDAHSTRPGNSGPVVPTWSPPLVSTRPPIDVDEDINGTGGTGGGGPNDPIARRDRLIHDRLVELPSEALVLNVGCGVVRRFGDSLGATWPPISA